MVDPLSSYYRRNEGYSPRFDGTFWLLTSGPDSGIALDETMYRVWESFNGIPTARAVAEVSAQAGIPPGLVESSAKVLARAGLLSPRVPLPPLDRGTSSSDAIVGPLPLVSVVILASRQARRHLETCLPSVEVQTYPALEVFVVDNRTTDDSAEYVSERHPAVRIIATEAPLGFAAANNLALRQTRGEFVLLLNEDVQLAPECVAECVRVARDFPSAAVVAPKMRLFYMRRFLNSMGTSIFPDGRACDNFGGYLDVGQFDAVRQVFAACFGASLLRRAAIDVVGELDERYEFYYEDLDWAYGARLRGYDVVAAPRAVVYHKFSATIGALDSAFKLQMAARNRLLFVWKNVDLARARRLTRMYRLHDRLSTVHAKREGRLDLARAYRRSALEWMAAWPALAVARWRRRRTRHSPSADDDAFALVEGIPQPALYGRYPVLSVSSMRDHYMTLSRFRPESFCLPAESPLPEPLVPSLKDKVSRRLRTKGLRGVAREGRDYLRWLVDSW